MKKTKKRQAHEYLPGMRTMRCPYCKSPLVVRSAEGIYRSGAKGVQLLACSNYPACDAYVRVHPGTTTPMGSLANRQLRALRRRAHEQFNKLYTMDLMSKIDAYSWLAGVLNVPKSQAHIGYLGDYYCQVVIDESRKLLERRGMIQTSGQQRLASGGDWYA